ncbi:hypothetical protein [Nodularia sp. LEGE 04288]
MLGNAIPGIVINQPPKLLVDYWQEYFGFSYTNESTAQLRFAYNVIPY